LDLGHNQITDEGVRYLSQALQYNTVIIHLLFNTHQIR